MPRTSKDGTPKRSKLPSTLQRSPAKAQRTFAKTYDSAAATYGDGERAARTAFAAVKHSFEKVGDHWEPKDEKGPSDPQAARDTLSGSATGGAKHGGVNATASRRHLYELARRLGVPGRSRMSRDGLVRALEKVSRQETARARRG